MLISEHVGRDVRYLAAFALVVAQIVEPLFHKRADIVIERRGIAKRVYIARPAQALVALRAVGGDIDKISALPPHNVGQQPIEPRIARLHAARARHVGVHDKRRNVFRRYRAARNFQVPEPVKSKFGSDRPRALYGKAIRRLCAAKIVRIELAAHQNFGKPQSERSVELRGRRNLDYARDILTEIVHSVAIGRGYYPSYL